MRRPLTALAVAFVGSMALAGCDFGGVGPDDLGPVTSVTWEQHQAIEDFDATPGETTDPTELARFEAILAEHDILGQNTSMGEDCDGGRTTDVSYLTEGGFEVEIHVAGCARGDAGGAIDDLVSEWRTAR